MNSIEITATNLELAIAEAIEKLQTTEEQLNYDIIKTSGLIRKKTTYIFSTKKTSPELALDFINGIISNMKIDCVPSVVEEENAIVINLSGKDTSLLIGYRGDVLDSLQYLSLLVCNKNNPNNKRLIIDGENYREKRTQTLSNLAKKLAFKASKTNTPISLEPMNPFERRIIHAALSDDRFVTTESEGDEPNRFVVIKPNKRTFDRPRANFGDGQRSGGYNRNNNGYNRSNNNNSYVSNPVVTEKTQDIAPETVVSDDENGIYNSDYSKNFKKTGVSKMRSFGAPKSKYF